MFSCLGLRGLVPWLGFCALAFLERTRTAFCSRLHDFKSRGLPSKATIIKNTEKHGKTRKSTGTNVLVLLKKIGTCDGTSFSLAAFFVYFLALFSFFFCLLFVG